MKKNIFFLVVILFIFMACRDGGPDKAGNAQSFKFRVKVISAENMTFQKFINYKGTVSAWQTANISPELSGRIARIYKKVGEEVERSELLAELDMTALKLQLKQAEATISVSEKGNIDAKLNYERLERLFEKNAVSSYQVEKAQLSYVTTQAQLQSARATLDIIEYNIEKSHMRAPFNGIVSAKNFQEGDMINPMMGTGRAVLELLDLSRVKIVVDLSAEDIEKIEIGKKCMIKVAGSETELDGEVYSKNLAADPSAKTFRVEIVVENTERKIRANTFADVWIEIEKREHVLVLPIEALLQEKFIMVVEDGKAKRIEVKTGSSNETSFIVEQGLRAGQNVIIEGNYDLQDGQEVIF